MQLISFAALLLCARLLAGQAQSQPAAPPQPDVLILVDGEKLLGRFVRSNGGSLLFKSDILGEVTIDWQKVKELHSTDRYAVIQKDVKLGKHEETSAIPQGAISASGGTLTIDSGPGQQVQKLPVADAAHVIDETTFQKAVLHQRGPLEAWNGAVTAGATLVEATQHSRTFTGALHLSRAIPVESWLAPANRTTLDFTATYGTLVQPSARIKTEIYHLALEHDSYFTGRVFAFGQVAYDHNFSQGLDLQQDYGSGIGWTAIKTANESLDLKGSVSYLKQQFQVSSQNQNLFASGLAQAFNHRFRTGISFNQQVSITATWNNLNAYTWAGSAMLTLPVYKRLNFTLGTSNAFLNNPPPGFRKNSYQFTTGLTYSLGTGRMGQ